MAPSNLIACIGLGLLAAGLGACASGRGQRADHAAGVQPFASDPKQPAASSLKNVEFLEQYAATRGFTHGTPKNIAITPDGSAVFFLRSGPRSFVQDLFVVDTATGEESVFLTADKILAGEDEKLTAEELARRERMRLASRGIASFGVSKDGNRVLVPLSGRLFVIDRNGAKAGAIRELKSSAGYPIDPQFSPDGTRVACVREGDLYVLDINSGAETRLTTKTSETVTNGLAEFVAQEEMDRFRGFWWSPDSNQIAYEQADTAGMETFHIADAVNPEKEAQAWAYPRPGKKNAATRLGIIAASGGETLWLPWDHAKYEYIASVAWPANDSEQFKDPLLITVMNREQTEVQVLTHSYNARQPKDWTTALLTDRDAAWVNLRPSLPKLLHGWHDSINLIDPESEDSFQDKRERLCWITDSSGRPTIMLGALRGGSDGALKMPDIGVQGFVAAADGDKSVYLLASTDPTQTQIVRVDRVSPGTVGRQPTVTQLTHAAGAHGLIVAEKAPVGVFTSALLEGTTDWRIARLDSTSDSGKLLRLTREAPPWMPRVELDVVGERQYHTAIIRPRDFDPARKYPVIVNVYGGPHHQMVRATPQAYFLQQWIADQGFIIAMIDGRGTPNRGRDWERAIKNDLIGPALEDQVAGIKALGAKHPEMDLSRVGIYGWSFGGYFSAMATMQRPDVFAAGCAGAPVCDWLDYDTCYTERYLGVPKGPDDEIYKKSSVLTYCKDLKRPLMIIHGTADDNVYFMHSLKMTQELFRQGKPFEFLPLAGFTHSVPDPVVTTRLYSRVAMFFKEKLGEPR